MGGWQKWYFKLKIIVQGICSADRILIVPNKYVSKIVHVDVINNIKVSFIQGDICEEDVEAIGV